METMDEINRLLVQRGLLPHSLCRERRGHGCLRGYIGAAPRRRFLGLFLARPNWGVSRRSLAESMDTWVIRAHSVP